MKTKELLALLKQHSDKSLLFEYKRGSYVGAHYHITEVKHITIDSVDCGAGTDFWKETVIQLWESPLEKDTRDFMKAFKALGILNKVNGIKPMDPETEVKFEYGNVDFHTAQLYVKGYQVENKRLILQLAVEKTDCKAKETCGVAVVSEMASESNCAPGSGCC